MGNSSQSFGINLGIFGCFLPFFPAAFGSVFILKEKCGCVGMDVDLEWEKGGKTGLGRGYYGMDREDTQALLRRGSGGVWDAQGGVRRCSGITLGMLQECSGNVQGAWGPLR